MKTTNLFSFRCFICQNLLALPKHGICCACLRQIPRFNYCGVCGSHLPDPHLGCGLCCVIPPSWDRIVYLSPYQPPLSDLIHRFKFQQHFYLDRTLARLLLLAVLDAKRKYALSLPDVLLPVPLHHQRQWQRGYNQTDLLCGYLSHFLQIPVEYNWIKRQRATPSQRGLHANERQKNLINAFKITKSISVRSVAIIDDVITTGATMHEICTLLRQQGVEHIQVWALCRT